MNKKVLTEVGRVLEIMGLSRSLLLEQGRLMARLLSYGARSADEWWTALQKSLQDDSIYKKFEGKIPLGNVLSDVDFTAVLELVLSKTPNVTKRSKKLMGPKLRGIGLDVSDEIAGKIGKATVNTSKNPAKPLTLVLADITGDSGEEIIKKSSKETVKKSAKVTSVETKKIFSKLGKESMGDVAPLRKSLEDLISGGQKSTPIEDIQKFLSDLKLPETDIDAWIKALKNGKDISESADIKKIFTAALGNTNYTADLLKTIEGNPKWQKWVQKADFDEKRVAKMLGLEVGDELANEFYNILINKKWFKRWIVSQGKKGLKSKGFWKILTILGGGALTGMLMNWMFGKKYAEGDKQKEGIGPAMYNDVASNKEMVKNEGGYTDDEAKQVANLIYRALEEDEYYEDDNGDYMLNLVDLKTAQPRNVLIGSADDYILEIYEVIPTVLAASQVAHWFEKLHGPGTLKSTLENKMVFSSFIAPAISATAGDITIKDILEELDTKLFCLTCQNENTQKGYKKRIKALWPQYQVELEDTTVDPAVVYYSRVLGPIDIKVLGAVLEECTAGTGTDMDSCLVNIGPREFNKAWASVYPEGVKGQDPYGRNYDPEKAVDMASDWDDQFRNLLGHEEEDRKEGEESESKFDELKKNKIF